MKVLTYPAIILAAGRGQRLSVWQRDVPKPLVRFLGLSLLERNVKNCIRAGVKEIYVVTGYKRRRVERFAGILKRRYKVSIKCVYNPDWRKGNIYSVLAVKPYVKTPFYLLMGDHVFEPEMLVEFMERSKNSVISILAVDPDTKNVLDEEDATKVEFGRKGEIIQIGKDLKSYSGIDTGLFFCKEDFLKALEDAVGEGATSLTEGVREMARRGRIKVELVRGYFWGDMDTQRAFREAEARMLKSIVKVSEDGWVSLYINRPISVKLTRYLVKIPVTPNMISFISFLMCLLSAYLFSQGNYISGVIAGLITQLSSILDGCDGEIARLRLSSSPSGAFFDTLLDRYADILIVLGISAGYWRNQLGIIALVGCSVAISGFLMASYSRKEYQLRFRTSSLPMSSVERLTKRDLRLFLILVFSLLNVPFWGVVALGVFYNLFIFIKLFLFALRESS